jgi:esterase/lipase
MGKLEFKKGIYKLNENPMFDYQLNRLIMWNGGEYEAVKEVASKITDFNSWFSVLHELSKKALSDRRVKPAIGYLRMAEFFMNPNRPETKEIYNEAKKMFYKYYSELFDEKSGKIARLHVPYENTYLPSWFIKASTKAHGTVLLHGGNDSLIEEFVAPICYLADSGYDVIAFEGPGQGESLRSNNLKFTYQWEKPVKAILDCFKVDDVTIIGISLGGALAPRAAAFDKRIKRVVAWSVMPSLYDTLMSNKPNEIKIQLEKLLKNNENDKVNAIYNDIASKMPIMKWSIEHSNYAYGTDSVFDYLKEAQNYSIKSVANKITQDILLIGAKEDIMVDFSLYKEVIDILTNVRSLTFLAFGNEVDAGNHCNIGNVRLVLDSIISWLEFINAHNLHGCKDSSDY